MNHPSPRVEEELRHRDLYAEERRVRLDGLLLACLRNPHSREPLDALVRHLSDTRDPAALVLRHAVSVHCGPLDGYWACVFVLRVKVGENPAERLPPLEAQADNAGGRFWPPHAWGPFCRVWDRLAELARRHNIVTGGRP